MARLLEGRRTEANERPLGLARQHRKRLLLRRHT